MFGSGAVFRGDAMSAVVQGVIDVRALIGQPPVIVGGLAVLCRLSSPYRATVDLDLVDRRLGPVPQLEVLRAADGAMAAEPAAVLLPTRYGELRVDVLEVRQVELDEPNEDPGDRLHASAHGWAYDTATEMSIAIERLDDTRIDAATLVAEPGPLVAMKLQAVMNRSADKQGTDLVDIVRLVLDAGTGPVVLKQVGQVDAAIASDIALHVDLWFVRKASRSLQWMRRVTGADVIADDIDLVAELLLDASQCS